MMKLSREDLLIEIAAKVGLPREEGNDRKFTKRELVAIHNYLVQTTALLGEVRDRVRQLERTHRADR